MILLFFLIHHHFLWWFCFGDEQGWNIQSVRIIGAKTFSKKNPLWPSVWILLFNWMKSLFVPSRFLSSFSYILLKIYRKISNLRVDSFIHPTTRASTRKKLYVIQFNEETAIKIFSTIELGPYLQLFWWKNKKQLNYEKEIILHSKISFWRLCTAILAEF